MLYPRFTSSPKAEISAYSQRRGIVELIDKNDSYEFLAEVSNKIIRNVRGVNRVCYDVSSKPPATIEWE